MLTKANIVTAALAQKWGAPGPRGIRAIRPGDRISLYVSHGVFAGYWGCATVTSDLFVESAKIWSDGQYPFRFKFKLDAPLREVPVNSKAVLAQLKAGKFSFPRRTTIMPLTPAEFQIISRLVAAKDSP